ncbi:MAG: T9SS type A sorting domain-containing protein, partial [Candidatus Cloacimonetes bacterium]|nr:T9SS type A sorting domain-containing protein [Candidatus Cloacimonadota bacterium]
DQQAGNIKLCFAYSDDNGQTFQKTVLDIMGSSEQFPWIDEPVIEIMDDGAVIILYDKFEDGTKNLFRALSDANAENFDVQLIAEDISDEVHLIEKNGILTITYQQADSVNINQFTAFQYFTDTEKSVNEDGGLEAGLIKFWGPDVFFGHVHSNDDIWIQQAGGGNNGGWPTFWGPVTTAGIIRHFPTGMRLADSGAPMEEIFRGGTPGWEENVGTVDLPETAVDIRENGLRPFETFDADVVYVKIDGYGYDSMLGYRELSRIDSFEVYSWYPHNAETAQAIINSGDNWFEDAEHIHTNNVPVYQMNWIQGPSGTLAGQSVWVENELWIEGAVGGMQTWGCADTVFITGDITYTNTPPGNPPDDPSNPNLSDYFGLVSEKQILIRYKHIDPWTNELRDDNCNDIYLYGAYAAIAKGDSLVYGEMSCHYDGIFSFEYQHPHGSTPDFLGISPYTGNDTLYTFIDLHKYIYPLNTIVLPAYEGFILHGNQPMSNQVCGYPYESNDYLSSYPNNSYGNPEYQFQVPYGTDLPWYNPVWPESADDIVFERGVIKLFGSVIQRRRGYIHLSGIDPYNHDGNEWDPENFQFDGDHPSTGYWKDYRYDSRLLTTELVDFPRMGEYYNDRNLMISNSSNGGESFTEPYLLDNGIMFNIDRTYFTENEDRIILSLQRNFEDIVLFESTDDGFQFDYLTNISMDMNDNSSIFYESINLTQENVIYLDGKHSFLETVINGYDLNSNELNPIHYEQRYPNIFDFNISHEEIKMYVNLKYWIDPPYISINYSSDNDLLDNEVQWMPEILENIALDEFTDLILTFDESDSLYIFLYAGEIGSNNPRNLYLVKGFVEVVSPVTYDDLSKSAISVVIYPNPFNPSGAGRSSETEIRFSLVEDSKIKLTIYNLKGQKVKTLIDEYLLEGDHFTRWDGVDSSGLETSSGIYFLRFKQNERVVYKKMVLFK